MIQSKIALILKNLSSNFKIFDIAVEVRHNQWQKDDALKFLANWGWRSAILIIRILRLRLICNCALSESTDISGFMEEMPRNGLPRMPAEMRFIITATSENELKQIKKRIEQLANAFERLTVIANNHYRGGELANALELKCMLTGLPQRIPEGLIKEYPQLARIARKTNLF